MNKNDLRYIKTERAITEAYRDLKENGKHVRVKDLCDRALINKSTFYEHYADLPDLERTVQKTVVQDILKDCPHVTEAFSDTSAFCRSIIDVFSEKRVELNCYFSGDVMLLCASVERELLDMYCGKDPDHDLQIRFVIGGAAHVLLENTSENTVEELIALINRVV